MNKENENKNLPAVKNRISVHKGGGLHARMAEAQILQQQALAEAKSLNPNELPNRIVLMLDCSGSMESDNKIELLRQAFGSFIEDMDPLTTSVAVETFGLTVELHKALSNDKADLSTMQFLFSAEGGTPMHLAMAKAAQNKLTRGIIISDGDADRPESAIAEARNFVSKEPSVAIDTVHIGDSSRGEETLKQISEITGGLFVKFRDTKSFALAFHFLLPEHRAEAKRLLLTAGANEVS